MVDKGGRLSGLAASSFNYVRGTVNGLSIGIVNYAWRIEKGLQLGLVNIVRDNPKGLRVLPVFNTGSNFSDRSGKRGYPAAGVFTSFLLLGQRRFKTLRRMAPLARKTAKRTTA